VSIALAVVEAKEVFAVQDDVTQEIVSALVSKMRRAETARAKRKREAKSGQHVDVCRRSDAAVVCVRNAMRLYPLHRASADLYRGRALYFARRYDEALLPLKTCATRAPGCRACYMYLAPLYAELGRLDEARQTVRKLLELAPRFSIENSVRTHLPYVPAAMSQYVRGLDKAGVPER
jgi:Flp pilus assembly protein TadD